jgi:hypothetical protein
LARLSPVAASRHHGSVEEYRGISYIVRDANYFAVTYVYFESAPGRTRCGDLMTRDEARKVAAGIAKLPELPAPAIAGGQGLLSQNRGTARAFDKVGCLFLS